MFDIITDMRRQRVAMVQTAEQYLLVYQGVKQLFQEQLKVIDSHPYENLDEDGEPLGMEGEGEGPIQHQHYEEVVLSQERSQGDGKLSNTQ